MEIKNIQKGFSSDKYEINSYEYLQVIYDGKIDLIAKRSIELFRSYTAMGGEGTPEYISHQNYYLITKDGKFHPVELDKEAILHALPDFQNKIKKYSAKHNLSFGKVNELQKILIYYESLIG